MSVELQPALESFAHITRAGSDWKLPTVVTVATRMSTPLAALEYVKVACPLLSVTALPVRPAFGPLVTLKLTVVLGRPTPLPSTSVAVSDACPDVNAVTVVRASVRVAVLPPAVPMARHGIDSLCLGWQ